MPALLLGAPKRKTIGDVVPAQGALWETPFDVPLSARVRSTPEPNGARPPWPAAVLRETLAKGGQACRPRIATPTLAAAFIDPALKYLEGKGGTVRIGARAKSLLFNGSKVLAIETADGTLPVSDGDTVVLAMPPWVAAELVPGLTVPNDFRSIVNAHFKRPGPHILPDGKPAPLMLGVIGGTAEWMFSFDDRISVTVSGADAIVDREREALARELWADVGQGIRHERADARPGRS